MIRRSYSIIILTIAFFTFGAFSAMAQILITSGVVELEKDDQTRAPLAGALIEIYRTDVKAGFPSRKTSKGGDFTIAGLQPGATYVLSVSAPNAAPTIFPNVRGGQEKLLIIMKPGDGSKWSEDEVRKAIAGGVSAGNAAQGEPSAEQKKAQEEYEAKRKELESKKANAAKTNELVNRLLKEGDAAFKAKDYNTAIAKFNEGFDADPEFAGSAPVMLNNKATALRSRAADLYNQNVKNTDTTGKYEAFGKVKADFAEALTLYSKSFAILKGASPTELNDATMAAFKSGALNGVMDTVKVIVLTEQVGEGVIDTAAVMMPEYIDFQTDAAKKLDGKLLIADLYRIAQDRDKAVAAYKAVLETSPDNQEALVGAGLVLVDAGWLSGDKTKSQEGANLLQKFVSVAPETHKLKEGAVAYLELLKKENIVPVKSTTTKKRP